jgi:putative ABC transport system permease protein
VNISESARIALRSLRVNKLRALLTMLGIVIGVGAVITLMSSARRCRQPLQNRSASDEPDLRSRRFEPRIGTRSNH